MCSIFDCVYVYFKHEEKDKKKNLNTQTIMQATQNCQ